MTLDCTHPNTAIQKKLEAIYALHTKKMDFRLDKGPYIDLLAKLSNPHHRLPPTIHVAGTNGKGSTIAFLKSIFEAARLKVHTYTSPHLLKFNERITLCGHHIDDATLLQYLDKIETVNAGAPITFFEYTTALAFAVMADTPADICILETGLGGRLDCTNVIQNPIATIISSIGYDHMDWLGSDIKIIAGEKAGIMKRHCPCFIAPQNYDLESIFQNHADIVDCPISFVNRMDELSPLGLLGDHQYDNASTAVATINAVAPHITQTQITHGLKNTIWPARMEKISDSPEVWFDCGHNADGAKVIAAQLQKWKSNNPETPIHLILGLAGDKNPNEFLKPIEPYIDSITCVDLLNARNPQNAVELKNKLVTAKPITVGETTVTSIKNNGITFITGSLYLYEQITRLKF